jgi:exopolysaccharide production protein ExoZ
MQNRVHALDYLRGIAACTVMLSHYFMWINGHDTTPLVVYKLAGYSVSIFYVLSGLTLYLVYFRGFSLSFEPFYSFAVKRILRIYPLLWLAIAATIYIHEYQVNLHVLFYNVTGIFSLTDAKYGIARGSWSIGNELVFYLLFPIFVLLLKLQNKIYYYVAFALVLLAAAYFTFFLVPLDDIYYVFPINQLFLFVAGITIGHIFSGVSVKQEYLKVSLIILLVTFLAYPTATREDLWIGWNRVVLCSLVIVTCAFSFLIQSEGRSFIGKGLSFLGDISYSVYLIHPLSYEVMRMNFEMDLNPVAFYLGCLGLTMTASYIIYRTIEAPAMAFGRNIGNRFKKNREQAVAVP